LSNQKKETEEEIVKETEAVTEETEAVEDQNEPSELEQLEAKVKEWEEKYLRLYAEYDNFKKRSQREKDARYADAVADVVTEFLPVADNLERAVAIHVESEEAKSVLEGVNLVKKQMEETLSKLEVSEIKALGEEFDPNLHNAVMHVEDETAADNVVVEEFMKGYRYKNDRVIRYSMVKVAN